MKCTTIYKSKGEQYGKFKQKKVCEIACRSTYHLFDQYDRRKSRQYELWSHQSTELQY